MPKLWLIEADTSGYDRYSRAVVVADNFAEARAIHPGAEYKDKNWWEDDWAIREWTFPRNVRATQIGEATLLFQPGTVICAKLERN